MIDKVVPVSSTQAAELTKLLENIHRSVNIGLVNEMKMVADKMGIDIHEVIRAAATKPFGFVPYYPGPGIGGHCIPIDPFYLTWKAREYGMHTRFIELAGEINSSMPDYVVSKVSLALNQSNKSIKGSPILVLGIAYKKNVDDVRESPRFADGEPSRSRRQGRLQRSARAVVPEHARALVRSVQRGPSRADNFKRFDCVLLATDHDKFDYELIRKESSLIVDCRGKFLQPRDNIVRA